MSWRKVTSRLCLTLALTGCGAQRTPAAEPSGQPAASEPSNQKAARARLRAVVRDQSFLEHLPEAVRASTISEPFLAHMLILYMVDDRGAARGAQASDLAESGVTREALRAVVEWNLAGALRDPVSCTSHSVDEPKHGHYYESSRLLLDKQWADLAAKVGTVVVAVPSNDTLFVACNPTPEVLQKLAVVVQNTYPQAPRPVSPSLLTWTKDGFRELPAR
ncbi:MAG: hypothetical protein WDO69_14150 [Pseudomonadota bacterium]